MGEQVRGSLQILVAEDDLDIRESLKDFLEGCGYEVEPVCNGLEALEYLSSHDRLPDLMILDMSMPVMNGWQCLEHIRESSKTREMPVIACSGYRNVKVCDADALVPKPFDIDLLLSTIKEVS